MTCPANKKTYPIPIGRAAADQERRKNRDPHWPLDETLKLAHDLWAECHFRADSRLRIHRGEVSDAPFAIKQFNLPSGPHELLCWLPGPHPRHAHWWAELDVWVLLRCA